MPRKLLVVRFFNACGSTILTKTLSKMWIRGMHGYELMVSRHDNGLGWRHGSDLQMLPWKIPAVTMGWLNYTSSRRG